MGEELFRFRVSNYCCVCGLDQGEPIWGETGDSPTYNICQCCATEFGLEDTSPASCFGSRAYWLRKLSGRWWSPPPDPGWSLEEQLKNIPEGFRDEDISEEDKNEQLKILGLLD